MHCVERFNELKSTIPSNVKIVAVSKTKPATLIEELYKQTGHRVFGENKAQELDQKQLVLPKDIDWHFIGHLQTNKIKYIAPYVGMIQSVDSFKLLKEINKEAIRFNRVIPCLLQFHIAQEEAKYGFSINDIKLMFNDKQFYELEKVKICGVMGMATYTSDKSQIRKEFSSLNVYFNALKAEYFSKSHDFKEISMGMSDDYKIAIDEGSTIVRIGSGIFGER
jgi:PLP dependent protein